MKRPFKYILSVFASAFIIGQHTDIFPYTALFVMFSVLCIIFYFRKKEKLLLLLPIVFLTALLLRFATKPPVDYSDINLSIKGVVTQTAFTDDGKERVVLKADKIIKDGSAIEEIKLIALVYMPDNAFVKTGDTIAVTGTAAYMSTPKTNGQFNMENYLLSNGYDLCLYSDKSYIIEKGGTSFFRIVEEVRQKITDVYYEIFPAAEASVISAMVTGSSQLLDSDTRAVFADAGAAHVLAVSGLHTAVICGAVLLFMTKILKLKKSKASASSIAFVVLYALFTGFKPSVVRASIMLIIVLFANVTNRESDTLNSLCAAAFLMLVFNPFLIYNSGFLLSFTSVIGVIVGSSFFGTDTSLVRGKVLSMIQISFMVTIFTLPVTAYFFYSVPLAGIFVNLLIIPLLAPLLIISVLCGIMGLLFMKGAVFLGGSAYVILKLYEFICTAAVSLPLSSVLTGNLGLIFCAVYYILIIILTARPICHKRQYVLSALCMAVLFVCLYGNRLIFKNNYIYFVDVGQGDCALMQTYNGKIYVFDTGGYALATENNTAANIIIPLLNYYGKNSVDALFISHPDNDHCGGACELMENTEVKKVILSDYDFGENELLENITVCAESMAIPVEKIKAGDTATLDENIFAQCIYPLSYKLDTEDTTNNGSMVLSLKLFETTVLLTGDIDKNAEEFLCYAQAPLNCDVLKVSHHGSKYSTAENFVNLSSPEYAVVSYGKNNMYGHPDSSVIERLENSGCNVFSTAQNGTVILSTNKNGFKIYGTKE